MMKAMMDAATKQVYEEGYFQSGGLNGVSLVKWS